MNYEIKEKMLNWIDKVGSKNKEYFSADEWTSITKIVITPQRLTSMYKKGLVERTKNKEYYGDDKYRYRPVR